ncbi:MAG: hypothetical protein ACRBB0_22470 [Pelagimonas sp.]|uniref:hypothetical protein n=1 Tax=Pelagimonas sp. TaxID=2073170 RepID=UPI003D6A33EE
MTLDLFTPTVAQSSLHPNFVWLIEEEDDALRNVLNDWAAGFIDRDGKFVAEFQRTFNSSWWELYLFAVLKSLNHAVDFSHHAPDFVIPDSGFAVEATISAHAQDATPEWMKMMADITNHDDIEGRYIETMVRLSNSISAKFRKYQKSYSNLPHMADQSYVIAIQNFGTPDAHQLGDVAMQRLLYDVRHEKAFMKDGKVSLPTGLFANEEMSDVSAIIYSTVATFGKARALSESKGDFVFQAVRIRNNHELIQVGGTIDTYKESLRDGMRVFHNPFARRPLSFDHLGAEDVRQFRVRNGELETTCHPEGDLCMRQVIHQVTMSD